MTGKEGRHPCFQGKNPSSLEWKATEEPLKPSLPNLNPGNHSQWVIVTEQVSLPAGLRAGFALGWHGQGRAAELGRHPHVS